MKTTKEDLIALAHMIDDAYRGYTTDNDKAIDIVMDFLERGGLPEKEEEKTVPITYGLIKATVGWSRFCDVTGGNHYAIKEWGDYPDNEVFRVLESHARELGFLG